MPNGKQIHETNLKVQEVHDRLQKLDARQERIDAEYQRDLAKADAEDANAARHEAAAADGSGAANSEYLARRHRARAERKRKNAKQRWKTKSTGLARTRAGWARLLAGLLAAMAAVAVGGSVLIDSVPAGQRPPTRPAAADVVVGETPSDGGEVADVPSSGGEAEERGSSGSAAEATSDGVTGARVHVVYLGSGDKIGARMEAGVPFAIERIGDDAKSTGTVRGASTDDKEAPLVGLAAGEYRITVDASAFKTVTCDGKYSQTFTIESGQQAFVTAYVFDQGGKSYGTTNCVKVEVRAAR